MQHPDFTILIHKSMQISSTRPATTRSRPAMRTITALRAIAGYALLSAGAWIAPEARPASARGNVGGISIAGSTDT